MEGQEPRFKPVKLGHRHVAIGAMGQGHCGTKLLKFYCKITYCHVFAKMQKMTTTKTRMVGQNWSTSVRVDKEFSYTKKAPLKMNY